MKRITALLLVLVMIVPLALMSCDKDEGKDLPPVGTGANTQGNTPNTQGGQGAETNPPETQAPSQGDYIYVPDTGAKYSGMFGIGAHGAAVVEFDDLKVTNRADKFEMVTNDFSGENPTEGWTIVSGAVTAAAETVAEGKDPKDNMVAAVSGDTMAYFGDPSWNYVQLSLKVKAVEIGDGVSLYAAVKDDKNYVEVVIGEDGGKYISAYTVVNGEKTLWGSKFPYDLMPLAEDSFKSCSVTLNKEYVSVYVNGNHLFDVYSTEEVSGFYGSIGVGTWSTVNSFDNLKAVRSDGTVLYENDFSNAGSLVADFVPKAYTNGSWGSIDDWQSDFVIEADDDAHGNVLKCVNGSINGAAVIVSAGIGNEEWKDYTFECDMRIDGAAEGWHVWTAVQDDSNYATYNIGGWGNTQTCFEPMESGAKSTLDKVSFVFKQGEWYHILVEVHDMYVRTHITNADGEEVVTNTYLKTLG